MTDDKSQKRNKSGAPHPADIYAGLKVRELRAIRRMTQTELARQIDISFQQIQKYENARNRMSVSMIYMIAEIMDVSPSYFFKEEKGRDEDVIPILDRKTVRLVTLFESIPDQKTKDRLLKMIEAIVDFLKPSATTNQ